jgi:hypothetical protein
MADWRTSPLRKRAPSMPTCRRSSKASRHQLPRLRSLGLVVAGNKPSPRAVTAALPPQRFTKRSGSSISLIGFTWKTSSIRETVYADLSATERSSQSRGLRDISDANHAQEINFGGCFSRLRRKKCIDSIDCYGIPADASVWFIPFRRGNPEALRATVSAPLFRWVGTTTGCADRRIKDARSSLCRRRG